MVAVGWVCRVVYRVAYRMVVEGYCWTYELRFVRRLEGEEVTKGVENYSFQRGSAFINTNPS
jgi:hypothetical protein